MGRHAPWYPRYPKDYNADARVRAMSDDQDLAFRRMLDASWELGPLPNDTQKLAAIVRYDEARFDEAWSFPLIECWKRIRGGKFLINSRLEFERKKMMAHAKTQAENGRKGGRPRKRKTPKEKDENPTITHGFPLGFENKTQPKAKKSFPDPHPQSDPDKIKTLPSEGQLSLARESATVEKHHPPNPVQFIAFWYDADEHRDFEIRFEPLEGFKHFIVGEAKRLGWTRSEGDLQDYVVGSLERFRAEYSRRDGKGKTRGKRIGPARLTEELVAWLRKDFGDHAKRQATRHKTQAERTDDTVRRLARNNEEERWQTSRELSDGEKPSEALSELLRDPSG